MGSSAEELAPRRALQHRRSCRSMATAAMAMLTHAPTPAVLAQVPFPLYLQIPSHHPSASSSRPRRRSADYSSSSRTPAGELPPPSFLLPHPLLPPVYCLSSHSLLPLEQEAAAPPHNNGAAGVTLERQFTVPAPIYLCSAAANLGSSMRNAGGARVPSWMARLSRQRRCLKSVTAGAWSARRALLPLCCPSSAPIMSAKTARPIPGLGRRGRPPRRITPSLAPAAWTPAASGDACPAVEGANG